MGLSRVSSRRWRTRGPSPVSRSAAGKSSVSRTRRRGSSTAAIPTRSPDDGPGEGGTPSPSAADCLCRERLQERRRRVVLHRWIARPCRVLEHDRVEPGRRRRVQPRVRSPARWLVPMAISITTRSENRGLKGVSHRERQEQLVSGRQNAAVQSVVSETRHAGLSRENTGASSISIHGTSSWLSRHSSHMTTSSRTVSESRTIVYRSFAAPQQVKHSPIVTHSRHGRISRPSDSLLNTGSSGDSLPSDGTHREKAQSTGSNPAVECGVAVSKPSPVSVP